MSIAVVTDSTAYLPSELIARHRVTVVPLTVVLNGVEGLEGVDTTPADAVRAVSARRVTVSTSQPAPEQFARAYRRLLDAGASGIVSVHLAAGLSGTWQAARLAAGSFDGRVSVVDSQAIGMGLGFPVLSAAVEAGRGADREAVRLAATAAADRVSVFFYVDTLEFLRRGGRINAASALLGTALSVKPILQVVDGSLVVRDKVRTGSRGVVRLAELVAEAAGGADVDVAVHHLAAAQRAADLRRAVEERLGGRLRDGYLTEAGPVAAAHVGPGLLCAVVHRRPPARVTGVDHGRPGWAGGEGRPGG